MDAPFRNGLVYRRGIGEIGSEAPVFHGCPNEEIVVRCRAKEGPLRTLRTNRARGETQRDGVESLVALSGTTDSAISQLLAADSTVHDSGGKVQTDSSTTTRWKIQHSRHLADLRARHPR